MDARIREADARGWQAAGKSHEFSIAESGLVGTGGFEPPTPSVSGKCSTTELRAFVPDRDLRGGSPARSPESLTDIPSVGNRAAGRATARALSAKLWRRRNRKWIANESPVFFFSASLPGWAIRFTCC